MPKIEDLLQHASAEALSAKEALMAECEECTDKGSVEARTLKWAVLLVAGAEAQLEQARDIIRELNRVKCADCNDTGVICCPHVAGFFCTCPAGNELQQIAAEYYEELKHDAEADDHELQSGSHADCKQHQTDAQDHAKGTTRQKSVDDPEGE